MKFLNYMTIFFFLFSLTHSFAYEKPHYYDGADNYRLAQQVIASFDATEKSLSEAFDLLEKKRIKAYQSYKDYENKEGLAPRHYRTFNEAIDLFKEYRDSFCEANSVVTSRNDGLMLLHYIQCQTSLNMKKLEDIKQIN